MNTECKRIREGAECAYKHALAHELNATTCADRACVYRLFCLAQGADLHSLLLHAKESTTQCAGDLYNDAAHLCDLLEQAPPPALPLSERLPIEPPKPHLVLVDKPVDKPIIPVVHKPIEPCANQEPPKQFTMMPPLNSDHIPLILQPILREIQHSRELLQQALAASKAAHEITHRELAALKAQMIVPVQPPPDHETTVQELRRQLTDKTKNLNDALASSVPIAKHTKEIQQMRDQLDASINTINQLNAQKTVPKADHDSIVNAATKELIELRKELSTARQDLSTAKQQLAERDAEIKKLTDARASFDAADSATVKYLTDCLEGLAAAIMAEGYEISDEYKLIVPQQDATDPPVDQVVDQTNPEPFTKEERITIWRTIEPWVHNGTYHVSKETNKIYKGERPAVVAALMQDVRYAGRQQAVELAVDDFDMTQRRHEPPPVQRQLTVDPAVLDQAARLLQQSLAATLPTSVQQPAQRTHTQGRRQPSTQTKKATPAAKVPPKGPKHT